MGRQNEEIHLSPRDWVRDHTNKVLEAGTTEEVEVLGLPIVLLTLRGARTGELRYTPVMRVEHEGSFVVVASKGGADKHPIWFYNIKSHPEVSLQDGNVTKLCHAREVRGEERAMWWDRAVAAFPSYADYQEKSQRQIPVFVLDPV